MRNELEKRVRKHRAEIDGIDRDIAELEARKRACQAVVNELDSILRLMPKDKGGGEIAERHLRVGTDPYNARDVLRKNRQSMHIKDILEYIGGDTGRNRRSSLASQLGAYVKKQEVFTKEGPNIFGLIDYGPEPVRLADTVQYEAMIDDTDVEAILTEGDYSDDIPF